VDSSLAENMAERLRGRIGSEVAVVVADDRLIEISSSSGQSDRTLGVRIIGAADFEVAFFVPSKPGSPFEQVFSGPDGEADMVIDEVVSFVCDLIAERLVLTWHLGLIRGGRRFLKTADYRLAVKRDFAWCVSWRGRHDWHASAT
jgi:hypothetical protein